MQSVGSGGVGQLGHGDNMDQLRPKLIMKSGSSEVAFGSVKQIAAGQHHSIALMKDGTVATFGDSFLCCESMHSPILMNFIQVLAFMVSLVSF